MCRCCASWPAADLPHHVCIILLPAPKHTTKCGLARRQHKGLIAPASFNCCIAVQDTGLPCSYRQYAVKRDGLWKLGFDSWEELWKNYTVFSVARNPYDRAASAYDYLYARRARFCSFAGTHITLVECIVLVCFKVTHATSVVLIGNHVSMQRRCTSQDQHDHCSRCRNAHDTCDVQGNESEALAGCSKPTFARFTAQPFVMGLQVGSLDH